MGLIRHLVLAGAFVAQAHTALAAADETATVRIVVEKPKAGEVVRNQTDMAPLEGVALAGERPSSFDVFLVVDVSGSTKYPSGIDVDGDGLVGESEAALIVGMPDIPNTDPDDSVLSTEVLAGKQLLEGLDPRRVRVGVISFSGHFDPTTGMRNPNQTEADAFVELPLSSNYPLVRGALEAVRLRGPHGGTNMEAGIKLAVRELAGLPGARSEIVPHAKKVILFLTDGKPSLPFGRVDVEDEGDIEATIDAANLARAGGITINSYGIGPTAIDYPIAAEKMASTTGGLYTPVRKPGDIVSLLSGVSFANVDDVVAVNLTLNEWAGPDDILLAPDGSFKGFVPVRPGKNRIRVSALASDGTRGSREFDILFKHQELTDAELKRELERIRTRSRELQLLMERERQKAFRRRERERTVDIEVEDDKEKSE